VAKHSAQEVALQDRSWGLVIWAFSKWVALLQKFGKQVGSHVDFRSSPGVDTSGSAQQYATSAVGGEELCSKSDSACKAVEPNSCPQHCCAQKGRAQQGSQQKVSGMLVASWLLITAEAAAPGAACLQLSSRCVRLGVVMAEPLSETPVRFSPCLELLDDIPLAVMQIELGAVAADDGLPDVPVVF